MIEGIATFTMVPSTMIIETPSAMNGIARHLPGVGATSVVATSAMDPPE
jgi:hypothetical protein